MTKILTVPYEATLPSFGSPAARKHVRPRDFVLQGNNGGWVTIPSTEYELDKKNGMVRQRSEDAAGNEVDWEAYTSYRWSGTIVTSGSRATVTNEALTFADADYADIEAGPDEQVQEALASDSVEQDDNASDETQSDNYVAGVSGYFIDRVTGNAEFNNITARGTIIASSGSIGGWTINSTYLAKDTGTNATSAGLAPSDYPFYAGATYANRATAPFRVTPAGAATASSIDLAGGSVTGTFTVSGTLRNAASPNARYELTSAGFKTYDSGNVQRAQILNDGSGWLGSSSVFSWTAAGVVSLNGSAVVGNSLDADKVTFTAPTLSGLTLTNNSPSAGYVAWSSFKLTYQGVSYTVASGNSNNKYIFWNKATSTTVLQSSATIPANAANQFIVCVNFSGTAYQSNFAPFIYADYISVGNLAAISADLGSITAGTITGATIQTASSGTRIVETVNGLFGYSGSSGVFALPLSSTSWYGNTITAGDFALGVGDAANPISAANAMPLLMKGNELSIIGLAIGHKTFTGTTTVSGTTNCFDPEAYSFARYTGSTNVNIKYIKKPTTASAKILYIKNDVQKKLTLTNNVAAAAPTGYAKLSLYGADVVMPSYGTCVLLYDSVNARWSLASKKADTTNTGYQPLSDAGYGTDVSIASLLPTATVIENGIHLSTKGGGTLQDDMTVDAASTWTMSIITPLDGVTQLFSDSDICFITNGTETTWFSVVFVANDGDVQTYTCTYASGTRPATYPAGTGVVNYGQSGQGFIKQTGNSGAPYWGVQTHAGAPYSTVTDRVRIGNLNGAFGIASTLYGLGVGDYSGGNYLRYDPSNGFFLSGGDGVVAIDANGFSTINGTANSDFRSYKFVESVGGTVHSGLYAYYNSGTSTNYAKIQANSLAATNSYASIEARSPAGQASHVYMKATANLTTGQLALDVGDGTTPALSFTGTVTFGGATLIDGASDTIQLRIQGNASQTANLQSWENSAGTVQAGISSDGRLGVGVAPSAGYSQYVKKFATDATWTGQGIETYHRLTSTSSAYSAKGMYFQTLHQSDDTTYTGAWTGSVIALQGTSGLVGTKNLTTAQAANFYITVAGAGTLTSGYGIVVSGPLVSGGGAITNNYGIYVSSQTAGATLNYAIYTNAGLVHFGDSVDLASGKNITLVAGNLITDTSTGSQIGTSTSQKLGFFGATPVVRPSAYTQTYSTADKTHANLTSATLTDSTGGTANTTLQSIGATYSQTEVRNNFADLAASNNAIIVDLTDLKQLVNALLDDLQALGLVG